jgi:hypothetical protein
MQRRIAVLFACVAVFACASAYLIRARAQSGPANFTITLNATYPNKNLLRPTGIFTTPGSGWLFFADTGHHMIKALESDGGAWLLYNIAGNGTAGYVNSTTAASAEFYYPSGVSGLGPVSVYTNYGTVRFVGINVLDTRNYTIRRVCFYFTPAYATPCTPIGVSTRAGTTTPGYVNGQGANARFQSLLSSPVLDPSNYNGITNYIVDPLNHVVRYIDTSNNVTTFAGTGSPGYVNGAKASAKFNGPSSATLDASLNLYISDVGNFVIRKISTAGIVSTFAGSGTQGYVNGSATAAQFAMPTDVFYNPSDKYVYVADAGNNCIRRISSTGVVSTYAGSNVGGEVDGQLTLARFSSPTGLVIDGTNMYITDSANNAIRKIDMSAGVVSTIYK